MKDAFDLWWEWAQKPHESFLMIDADIHNPIMELFAGRSARPRQSQRGCASVPRKSEVQNLNRIAARFAAGQAANKGAGKHPLCDPRVDGVC
jgi:hypothetical protein